MKRNRRLPAIRAVIVSISLAFAAQANATLIDDFNFTSGSIIEDTTIDASGVVGGRGIGGTIAAGWARDALYANLISGSRVEQRDCHRCGQGHFSDDAGSVGNGYESWRLAGGPQDLSNTTWMLDYGVDVPGFDVVMYFYNSQTDTIAGEIWWTDIGVAGMPGALGTLRGALGAGVLADFIFIEEFSVGGVYDPSAAANYAGHLGARDFGASAVAADFTKDNLRTPEPSTLALLVAGVAGVALLNRRAVA
jgi:hypothetical protein